VPVAEQFEQQLPDICGLIRVITLQDGGDLEVTLHG